MSCLGIKNKYCILVAVCLLLVPLTSCTVMREQHQAGSLSNYLYPDQKSHIDAPKIPSLKLPLRVGLAFVPEDRKSGQRSNGISEKEKMDLLNRIKTEFVQHALVESIEVIPTAYLTPSGGFRNLEQLRHLFNTDVIALVSYDQVQHTNEDFLSISYWTIVGAYIFEGEKNDTNTLIDLAVYHVPSRQMLFRAPGTSQVKSTATPIRLARELKDNSYTGFQQATDVLMVNLSAELMHFIERVKHNPSKYHVSKRSGYTGGGSLDGVFIVCLLVMAVYVACYNNRSA